MFFTDRADAGRRLAVVLRPLAGEDVVVVGLPRGGIPVGFQVARVLHAPLDVVVVRKLGVPYQPELAMGAVGEGGVLVRHETTADLVSAGEFARIEAAERAEVHRQARRLRGDKPSVALAGRTVVMVDDGIATGSTARAACQVVRALGARKVVLAVPVGPAGLIDRMRPDADDVVCLSTPRDFFAIGQSYADFSQVADEEVERCLHASALQVIAGPDRFGAELTVPAAARGVVVFAHGTGSSAASPRNRQVAERLHDAGFGTLLFDLLMPDDTAEGANVFDIPLLSHRLTDATSWLRGQPVVGHLPIGFFGASTGAAAAFAAAGNPELGIAAVVSRGGRPDLVHDCLGAVRAPTLLIVGGRDDVVIDLNRAAQRSLRCENRLAIVPGATHLFEEPGALQQVADLAAEWFLEYLRPIDPTVTSS